MCTYCPVDQICHALGSIFNKCSSEECISLSAASSCEKKNADSCNALSGNPYPGGAVRQNPDVFFNSSSNDLGTTGYNVDAAVKYADSYCASHSEWLCAEFVARSLNAGCLFSGITDYGNYKGYNLRYVPDLHQALKSLYGWSQSSSGTWCGSRGQVLIYNGDEHAAFAIGNCLLDQHNPSRCGTNSAWGTNIVLKP